MILLPSSSSYQLMRAEVFHSSLKRVFVSYDYMTWRTSHRMNVRDLEEPHPTTCRFTIRGAPSSFLGPLESAYVQVQVEPGRVPRVQGCQVLYRYEFVPLELMFMSLAFRPEIAFMDLVLFPK